MNKYLYNSWGETVKLNHHWGWHHQPPPSPGSPGLALPGAELPSGASVERLAAAPELRAVAAAGGTAVAASQHHAPWHQRGEAGEFSHFNLGKGAGENDERWISTGFRMF